MCRQDCACATGQSMRTVRSCLNSWRWMESCRGECSWAGTKAAGMGAGLAGDGLMGGELVSDGLASRNQRYRVLGLMWWDWAMAATEAPGCLHVSTMWALNAGLYWRRCVRGGVRARVSMVSACCEVDTIFRLWLSGLKVVGLEAYRVSPPARLQAGLERRASHCRATA